IRSPGNAEAFWAQRNVIANTAAANIVNCRFIFHPFSLYKLDRLGDARIRPNSAKLRVVPTPHPHPLLERRGEGSRAEFRAGSHACRPNFSPLPFTKERGLRLGIGSEDELSGAAHSLTWVVDDER